MATVTIVEYAAVKIEGGVASQVAMMPELASTQIDTTSTTSHTVSTSTGLVWILSDTAGLHVSGRGVYNASTNIGQPCDDGSAPALFALGVVPGMTLHFNNPT